MSRKSVSRKEAIAVTHFNEGKIHIVMLEPGQKKTGVGQVKNKQGRLDKKQTRESKPQPNGRMIIKSKTAW